MTPRRTRGPRAQPRRHPPAVRISDRDVDAHIDKLREKHAVRTLVARPVQDPSRRAGAGELPDEATLRIVVDNREGYHNELPAERHVVGSGRFGAPLEAWLPGRVVGDATSFPLVGIVGRNPYRVDVEVLEVWAQVKPAVTDEWVRSVTPFRTVKALRMSIRCDLDRQQRISRAVG